MDFCVSVEKKGYYDDEILQNGGRIFHITPKLKSIISFKEELYKVISENGYQNVLKITSNAMGFLDFKVAKKPVQNYARRDRAILMIQLE